MAWRNFKWTLFRITIQSSVKFWVLMLEIIWQPTVIEFLCIKQSTELIYGEIKETVLFFMQYMNNLNVTDIVDCSIMNVLIYVMWRISYLIIFIFAHLISAVGKVALPVALIPENHYSIITTNISQKGVWRMFGNP